MATAIYCIAKSTQQAERIVSMLRTGAAVRERDISVLFPDNKGTKEFAHEHNTKAPEGAVTGAGAGGVTGGVLGLLAGIGALAIPGVGPLIAAGPIMAALSGAAVGAAVGGIAGALIGMGIPEFEAKRYENRVKGGNILMAVHSENSTNTARVKEIFKAEGAEDISTTSEKTAVHG
jgi:hypothetical protein